MTPKFLRHTTRIDLSRLRSGCKHKAASLRPITPQYGGRSLWKLVGAGITFGDVGRDYRRLTAWDKAQNIELEFFFLKVRH